MRHISSEGLKLIKQFEGFSATPYYCPAGYLTIGYGHVIQQNESFFHIDKRQAENLLRDDVQVAEAAVCRLIPVPLHDGQYAALVSFTYNLGAGALQASTLRRKLLRGAYDAAAAEFPRWVYAGGRKLVGLVRRRAAERELFSSSVIPTCERQVGRETSGIHALFVRRQTAERERRS